MRVGRLILVVSTLVAILVFPLLLRDAVQAFRLPSAYAAPSFFDAGGRVYQNGNNDPNNDDNDNNNDGSGDDNNDESDNEGEDNDNEDVVCYESLNSNEEVPCDFEDNDNQNDNAYVPPPPPPAPAAPAPAPGGAFQPASQRCFAAGATGDVGLLLEGGSVTIRVVSPGLPQGTWLSLDDIDDLSGIPSPPAGTTMLDRMIWRFDAGSGCDGPAINPLPGAVNLGIPYNTSADKSKLQIVLLKDGVWQEIPTVPDPNPNNPYISATIQETGIYAVIQKP